MKTSVLSILVFDSWVARQSGRFGRKTSIPRQDFDGSEIIAAIEGMGKPSKRGAYAFIIKPKSLFDAGAEIDASEKW